MPTPPVVYLKDYTPSAFLISTIEMDVALFDDYTRVSARLSIKRNPVATDAHAALVLDGVELELESVTLAGQPLGPADYTRSPEHLTIPQVPDTFVLETVCRIRPQHNTQLMGFFASKDGCFTQCEAEGFRRITYLIDRPDVMARYTTTLHADKERYPVLLANGNLVASGTESDAGSGVATRHWTKWNDPFPKPSYLFAMVAARLDLLEDSYRTRSGRHVRLAIYVEPGKLDQTGFAMQALKKAMKWDEDVFGLELDLDQYTIVAVGDFNMGAMENKGLNIFNTKYVLARPDTATDIDYQNIDSVVAHEYFHNWTGNRVTCRDWFQLSLKEGLTVFRDQEYTADMYSRPVQRIRDVRNLRARQFPEDASAMAHAVRPQSYMEISNFYTATVYQKGAEVVRMIHTLIGPEKFRKGMELYFERHDGAAVTTDDFVEAMADASGVDLRQFKQWYDRPGTPTLEVTDAFDAAAQRYTLTVKQFCPPAPANANARPAPLHIPVALGLVGADGLDIPLQLGNEPTAPVSTRVLSLTEDEQHWTFVNVPARPVPSIARGFSAPVAVKYDYDERSLTHLMAYDSDTFNRWEAGQRLAAAFMLKGVAELQAGRSFSAPESFIDAFGRVLADGARDPAYAAEALSLPSEIYLAEQMDVVDPDAIHLVRTHFARSLAEFHRDALSAAYHANAAQGPYSPDAASSGRRALRNLCLAYLMETQTPEACELVDAQFRTADNMTDAIAALSVLADFACGERTQALESFYERWKDEPLVVDKWLRVQAMSRLPGTLDEVRRLMTHTAFSLRNPNKVYALIGGFSAGNHVRFHAADGSGYDFLADAVIELDALNPQVASRMARGFDRWKKFDAKRQYGARAALERIRTKPGLSKDVAEIVAKATEQ